jgi:gamma-glutamylaminecyclotransferase
MKENAPFVLHVRSEMTKLFVYGTLRQGKSRQAFLKDSKFLGKKKTLPKYNMVSLRAFPGLLEEGDQKIVGEVYEVNDDTLWVVDRIEGHPSFYERKPIEIKGMKDVQAYFLPRDKYGAMPLVESGDWLKQ